MERRDFFRAMLGAAALLPPSQVWPFRKIFIPSWLYQPPFYVDTINGHIYQEPVTITLANPTNFKPGDRVQIYRHAAGGAYYLVKNVTIEGGIQVVEMPSPDVQWLNLDRSQWPKER